MSRPRVVAISHPCLEEVNRAVYRELATTFGVDLHLVIPSYNDVGDGYRECPPVVGEPFEATLLAPQGRHLRLRRLRGLGELLDRLRPTHVIVDADPSTLIVNEVIWRTRRWGAKVWSLTAENLDRDYLREARAFLFQGKLKETLSSVMTWALLAGAKRSLDRLFTISRDGTRVLSRMGFAGRVTQIPLGFDPKLFYPQDSERVAATRKRLGLKHRTIGYFGRLSPEKGIHLLLEAAAKNKDLNWQILVDHFTHRQTPYISKLKAMVRELGLEGRLVFFESNHREMPDFMNAADIVVLPSVSNAKWKEQYGRVIPEAMACGKIVVGSDSGALPELIGDSGYLFPEGNAEALSKLLRTLISEAPGVLAPLGAKAAARARDHLSLRTQAEVWAGLLGVCAAETPRKLRVVR